MKRSLWLDGLRAAMASALSGRARARKRRAIPPTRRKVAAFEVLEGRHLLAIDYGDAPDTAIGSGTGNYNTLAGDNGPSHTIVTGLRMGASADGDSGLLQNAAANADDVNAARPDDEDGLANPAADLVLTIGAPPTVNVWVTNTTGTAATLYGWIDYNADGVFDNATERASVAVPDGTNNDIVTLIFPALLTSSTGTTYARFRLSTDAAAADPTAAAFDGEVEDYVATIMNQSSGIADSSKTKRIAHGFNGGPAHNNGDRFGNSAASLGDLDGDGIGDLVVGDVQRDTGGMNRGAVHVLFMNTNGTARISQMIASGIGGGPALANSDFFGSSVASLGDLDGDGATDLAIGAIGDDTGGSNRGAVHVLFLKANGSVKSSLKIAHNINGGPTLANNDAFGSSVAALGDLDGDGVTELAVGAENDDSGGGGRGAVHILFLKPDGSVESSLKIANNTNGGPVLANYDSFGSSVAALGDVDGDGVTDLAVGAERDDTGGPYRGAVHILFLNINGSVKNSLKIASNINGGPPLAYDDLFGTAIASLGDLDGDGITDLAIGAERDDTGGGDAGGVHIVFLNSNGSVKNSLKIASGTNGGPALQNGYKFGSAVASLGDLNGDGISDLAVGAPGQDTGGISDRGNLYVMFLKELTDPPEFTSPTTATVSENTTAVLTVTATDADLPPQTITFSIVGGADQTRLQISSGGVLSFRYAPDFENPTDFDRDNTYEVIVEANDGHSGTLTQTMNVTVTDVADPASVDSGDAPDLATGTGTGNYQTLFADNGPSHTIIEGLKLGAFTDGDDGTLQNSAANADDVSRALPIDEDGLANPAFDLALTVGAQPTVNVWVTNTTGTAATLYGWIDYNADGVFDNATERASVAVLDGTNSGIVTLPFPLVPTGYTGKTYARFRLSTDSAAEDSTGAAADGEVEDYIATIAWPSIGAADSAKTSKFPANISLFDRFGRSITSLGDLDGDGVSDMAVGADGDDTGGSYRGAVHILFMNANGSVKSSRKIASDTNGGPSLANQDRFGTSITSLGDLDGDGLTELAVGALRDGGGQFSSTGAVHVLFLNTNGGVKSSLKIASNSNGGPTLANNDAFGSSVAALGDLDGDGVTELAVGAENDDSGGGGRGAVHVLFLGINGSVKSSLKIANNTNGGPLLANYDSFGSSVAALGDVDGDGVTDLVVGAERDDTGGLYRGAVHVLFLNSNGSVKSSIKIANNVNGGPILANSDRFGNAVSSLGDLDGDNIADLAVGVEKDNTGGFQRGALYILFLNASGSAKSSLKIASDTNGGPTLATGENFGASVTLLGDLDGNGVSDLGVGATGDSNHRGAAHLLYMNSDGSVKSSRKIANMFSFDTGPVVADNDGLGSAMASLGDMDGDGVADLAVAASGDDTGGTDRGAVHIVFLNINGSVKSSIKIAHDTNGGPALADGDAFGRSIASLGDLDGDGVTDVAVGANGDDTGEVNHGAVHVLFLNANGSVKNSLKIADNTNGGPVLGNYDRFGSAVASLGDLDGDGVVDLAVGADGDGAGVTGGFNRGAVYVLFLYDHGGVKSSLKIASGTNGGPTLVNGDSFGHSISSLGDLDSDGVTDLAVGARDATGGSDRGAVYVLFLNANGRVKISRKIAHDTNGGPTLADFDLFGNSVTSPGDLDGDGVADLAVGAVLDDTGKVNGGATYILLLYSDGSVKSSLKIARNQNGGPSQGTTFFGSSLTSLGDLDGDGITDLGIGAVGDISGGPGRGAVFVLFLKPRVPGDFNHDGSVDAADYVVWRKTSGTNVPSFTGADGNGDGVVDEDDRQLWRANFGNMQPAVASSATAIIPHPSPLPAGEGSTGAIADDPLLATASLGPEGVNVEEPHLATASVGPEGEGVKVDDPHLATASLPPNPLPVGEGLITTDDNEGVAPSNSAGSELPELQPVVVPRPSAPLGTISSFHPQLISLRNVPRSRSLNLAVAAPMQHLQDDALVAWLASHHPVVREETPSDDVFEACDETASVPSVNEFFDAFDLAFEALGA